MVRPLNILRVMPTDQGVEVMAMVVTLVATTHEPATMASIIPVVTETTIVTIRIINIKATEI
jgi:hypothetical protein